MSCEPLNKIDRELEYLDAVVNLVYIYDLLRCEGHDENSDFMKGIKYAHDYLNNINQ